MNPLDCYRRLQHRWLRLRADALATEAEVDAHLEALDAAWDALDEAQRQLINAEAARHARNIRSSLPLLIDVAESGFPRRRADAA